MSSRAQAHKMKREVDLRNGKQYLQWGRYVLSENVMSDLNSMDNAAFDNWLMEQSQSLGMSDDELLVEVVNKTLREETVEGRAQGLIDLANLCMAMADKSMGSYVSVATCLTLVRH